jgi:hypothetical protein
VKKPDTAHVLRPYMQWVLYEVDEKYATGLNETGNGRMGLIE